MWDGEVPGDAPQKTQIVIFREELDGMVPFVRGVRAGEVWTCLASAENISAVGDATPEVIFAYLAVVNIIVSNGR